MIRMLNDSFDTVKLYVCGDSTALPLNSLFMSDHGIEIFARVEKSLAETSMTQQDFCVLLGYKASQYSQNWTHWRNRGFPKGKITAAAEILNKSTDWLATGKGVQDRITNPAESRRMAEIAGGVNVEPGPDITGRVPLISWVQAGNWSEVIDNYLPGQAEDWRLTTAKCSKHAYALRVVGDSMTNPHGAPSIPEGYIVIVEPDRAAKNGDIVIARLDDSMEATIKKLVIEGNTRYLKPLNPSYPVIHINGNCTICGVVIKVEFDL